MGGEKKSRLNGKTHNMHTLWVSDEDEDGTGVGEKERRRG